MRIDPIKLTSIITRGNKEPADQAAAAQDFLDNIDSYTNALDQFIKRIKTASVGDADVLVADQFFIRKEKEEGSKQVIILDANGTEVLSMPNKVLRKLNKKNMLSDILGEMIDGMSTTDLKTLTDAIAVAYTPEAE